MLFTDFVRNLRGSVLHDYIAPYKVADSTLLLYLNDAIHQLANTTHKFTSEITLNLIPDQVEYVLPDGVLYVVKAILDGRYLTPYTRRAQPRIQQADAPTAFTTDGIIPRITFWPAPTKPGVVTLQVAVTPTELTAADTLPYDAWTISGLTNYVAYKALLTNYNEPKTDVSVQAPNVTDPMQYYTAWAMFVRDVKRFNYSFRMGDDPSAQPKKWT